MNPRLVSAFLATLLLVGASMAQDRSTGGIKGKVRVETGALRVLRWL